MADVHGDANADANADGAAEGWQTLLMTMTMPADIDASGQVPVGWLLAKMDLAGAVLPGRHFGGPVQLVGLADVVVSGRPRLGQCITLRGRWIAADAGQVLLGIEAFSEERRPQAGGVVVKLLSAQLRYERAVVEVPENIFPGIF